MVRQPQTDDPQPRRQPVLLPARKPVRRASRVSLYEREIYIQLSLAAIDVLMGTAAILSEGEFCGIRYQGSTMITVDLTRACVHLSEACDLVTARNVEVLIESDARVHERARIIAALEAERIAACSLGNMRIDHRVRRIGRHFHLDLDVEAAIRSMG